MKARTWIFLLTPLLIVLLWPDQELTASSSQAEAQLSAPVRISDDKVLPDFPSTVAPDAFRRVQKN
jgi:hypothetical protein